MTSNSNKDMRKQPIITRKSDVVIVQLPFNFEALFSQPLSGIPPNKTNSAEPPGASQSTPTEPEAHDINKILGDLYPRKNRRNKNKKVTLQHLEELNSRHLRISDNGVDIFCIPCDTELTEGGRVKKSSMKLHLTCKRHLFNVKQQEARAIPPEIHRDEILNLYNCVLCGRAVTNDLHDVRRHCNGKKHQELLAAKAEEKLREASRNSEVKSSFLN